MSWKRSWIVTVLAAAILFSGGYAMMAWTAPVLYRTSRGARPGVELAGSDGTYAQSEQPAVCAGAAVPGVSSTRPPGSDQVCANLCTSNAQCSQLPPCCSTNVCGGGDRPHCFCP